MGIVEVFHLGALGDGVMVWPLLRAIARAGHRVEFIAQGEHAALAAREITAKLVRGAGGSAAVGEVKGIDIHRPVFERWWLGPDLAMATREDVEDVITFAADEASESGRRWLASARRARPRARIAAAGAPGSPSRAAVWKQWGAAQLGAVSPAHSPRGPVVLFTGAGSRQGEGDKRWPLEHWAALHAAMAGDRARIPGGVDVLAGPVEMERWNADERELFECMTLDRPHSGTLSDVAALAGLLRTARLVISADTGPAHLAAQLGVPVLALFGPTDPAVWRPAGPSVTVLAPPSSRPMKWLEPKAVHETALQMLTQP